MFTHIEVGAFYWTVPAPEIVNPWREEKGFCLNVDLMGSSASQGAVRSHMAVSPQEAGQADFSLPAVAVSTQVDLYSAMPRSLRLRT